MIVKFGEALNRALHFAMEKDPKVLRDYLMIHRQQILSDGFVGLVLAGRHLWGEDWSEIEK